MGEARIRGTAVNVDDTCFFVQCPDGTECGPFIISDREWPYGLWKCGRISEPVRRTIPEEIRKKWRQCTITTGRTLQQMAINNKR